MKSAHSKQEFYGAAAFTAPLVTDSPRDAAAPANVLVYRAPQHATCFSWGEVFSSGTIAHNERVCVVKNFPRQHSENRDLVMQVGKNSHPSEGKVVMPGEQLVSLFDYLDDPYVMLHLLEGVDVRTLTIEEKGRLIQRAYQADPFQAQVRTRPFEVSADELDERLKENGALIFDGELGSAALMVQLDRPGAPKHVIITREGEITVVPLVGRTERGGLHFALPPTPRTGPLEVELHSTQQGMLLDITIPGCDPYQLMVWQGAEIPEVGSPVPVADQIERLLFS